MMKMSDMVAPSVPQFEVITATSWKTRVNLNFALLDLRYSYGKMSDIVRYQTKPESIRIQVKDWQCHDRPTSVKCMKQIRYIIIYLI